MIHDIRIGARYHNINYGWVFENIGDGYIKCIAVYKDTYFSIGDVIADNGCWGDGWVFIGFAKSQNFKSLYEKLSQ